MERLPALFPNLALWKLCGFEWFPHPPIHDDRSLLVRMFRVPNDSPIISVGELRTTWNSGESWLQEVERQREKMLVQICDEAIQQLDDGKDRKKVGSELCNKLYGSRQGGSSFHTVELRILKSYYQELQDCVKQVRKTMGVEIDFLEEQEEGLSYEDKDWDEFEIKDVKERVPGVEEIFSDEELPLLTRYPSAANTALEIILKRLKKTGKVRFQKIKPGTFRKKLSEVLPI